MGFFIRKIQKFMAIADVESLNLFKIIKMSSDTFAH